MDNSVRLTQGDLSTAEIRAQAHCWSLAGDAALLNHLQQFSKEVLTRAHGTHSALEQLACKVDETSAAAANVTNKFTSLQNTQFVENRVLEDNESLLCTSQKSESSTLSQKLPLDQYKEAVEIGLNLLDSHFERVEVNISDSEDEDSSSDPTIICKSKNPYKQLLPFLIGSAEWWADNNVGLMGNKDTNIMNELPLESEESDQENITKFLPSKQIESTHNTSSSDLSKEDAKFTNDFLSSPFVSNQIGNQDLLNEKESPPSASDKLDSTFSNSSTNHESDVPKSFPKVDHNFTEELASKLGLLTKNKVVTAGEVQSNVEDQEKSNKHLGVIQNRDLPNKTFQNLDNLPNKVPAPAERTTLKSDIPKKTFPSDLFDDQSDELFRSSPKPSTAIPKKSTLFNDDKEEDDLFSAKKKPTIVTKSKLSKLFDDDDDDDNINSGGLFRSHKDEKSLLFPSTKDNENLFSDPLASKPVPVINEILNDKDSSPAIAGTGLRPVEGGLQSSTPAAFPVTDSFDNSNMFGEISQVEEDNEPREGSFLASTLPADEFDDSFIISHITPDLGFIEQSTMSSMDLESSQQKSSPFLPALSSTHRVTGNETSGYKTGGFSSEISSKVTGLFPATDEKSSHQISKTPDPPNDEDDLFVSPKEKSSDRPKSDSDSSLKPPRATTKYKQKMPSLFEDIDSDDDYNDLFKESVKNQRPDDEALFTTKQSDNVSVSSSRSSIFDDVKSTSTLFSLFPKNNQQAKKTSLFEDIDDDFDFFSEKPILSAKPVPSTSQSQSIENNGHAKSSQKVTSIVGPKSKKIICDDDTVDYSKQSNSSKNIIAKDPEIKASIFKNAEPSTERPVNANEDKNNTKASFSTNMDNAQYSKDDVDFVAKPRVIGKLHVPENLKINPAALLPGARIKKLEGHLPDNSKGNQNYEPTTSLLTSHKDRAKIQVKRRPQTRKARQEALRVSGIDFGLNVHESDEQDPETVEQPHSDNKPYLIVENKNIEKNIKTDNIDDLFSKDVMIDNKTTFTTATNVLFEEGEEDLFKASRIDRKIVNTTNKHEITKAIEHKLEENLFAEDDSLFKTSGDSAAEIQKNSEKKVAANNILFAEEEDDDDDDLFQSSSPVKISKKRHEEKLPNTNKYFVSDNSESVRRDVEEKKNSGQQSLATLHQDFPFDTDDYKQEPHKTTSSTNTLFVEGNDANMLKSTTAVKAVASDEKLFISNDLPPPVSQIHPEDKDEDLFASSALDEDEDDLFTTPIPKSSTFSISKHTSKTLESTGTTFFKKNIPESKNLFGDDDDDLNIFGSSLKPQRIPSQSIVPKSMPSTSITTKDAKLHDKPFSDPLGLLNNE